MFFKNLKIYLLIFLTSVIIVLFLFEIYASSRKDLFPSYGWQTENKMSKKITKCNKKKNIGIFGDSFVEYYGDDKINIAKILSKSFLDHNVCNFGLSGSDITEYINRFLYVLDNKIKIDKAIFYFYEGNDFYEFRYAEKNLSLKNLNIGNQEILNYNSDNVEVRELSVIKKLIKSTHSVNIIYREIIKNFFFKDKIDNNFVKQIYSEDKYYEVSLDEAIKRMDNTPNKIKKLFSSDILNVNAYKLALRNPNYFNEDFNPDAEDFLVQKKIAYHHIDFINQKCKDYNIDCVIIVIPNDQFLFQESKKKNVNIFRFNPQPDFGKSKIVKDIIEKYDNIFYPENVLSYEDYIKNDLHLTGIGNFKIANFTLQNLNN